MKLNVFVHNEGNFFNFLFKYMEIANDQRHNLIIKTGVIDIFLVQKIFNNSFYFLIFQIKVF